MLYNKSQIIILLLLCVVTFQAFIQPQTETPPQNIQKQEYFGYAEMQNNRMLQTIYTNGKTATASLKKIVIDSNTYRKSKGLSPLSENINLNQIISQWSQVMRKSLQLTQYLQIYGIQNAQTQYYASIPLQYIEQVIENISFSLYDGDYNKVGIFSNEISKNQYEVILVFQGGMFAQTITYNQDIIQNSIKNINQQVNFTGQAQSGNSTKKQINTTTNTNKPSSSQLSLNDSNLNQSTTNTFKNVSTQAVQENVSNSSVSKPEQKVLNEQKSNQANTTQIEQKPVSVQPPKSSISQPTKAAAQVPPTITPNSSNQVTNTSAVVATPPSVVPPSLSPISNYQVQPPKAPSNISSEVLPNNQITKPSSIKYPPKTIPPKQSTNKSDSFPNINLSHNVPTTFLKNQLFPFRGSITVPNPSGRQVNIILTRISDQQRLPFSQYLPANETSFYILANMNMTGDYYLSIFVGNSGLTSLTQYTIAPSAIGPFSSKPPSPIQTASLNLIGNSLWLNWNSSDSTPPAITQIIFSQDNGQTLQFIISNCQKKFKIPYRLFYAFNQGVTNIQISQAYSSDQSACSRSSPFSAPFNIIFNATTHNYEIFQTSNTFEPISLKYSKESNIIISGPAGAQLQNQIYLITPSKVFETYYLTSNSSNKYIQKGAVVNLSINLNETGVYILQINNSGGEALINIPLYVGDIYPLLPDFMDLSPTYIDLAALNQPTLLSDRRSLVLQLINNVRNAYGAPNVYLDSNLNNLAQNYSLTQIQGNFVGHIDRQGRTPSQRAAAAKIYQGVGENIAMNNNLTNAQLMLQRSPAHLKNMVNPAWTRVGLGILQNSNQFYYLTQQFSSRDFTLYPLSSSEINGIEENIVNFIISKYPFLVSEDKILSSKLSAYQSLSDRPYIISYLQGLGYRNLAVANLQVSYNGGNYINLIKSGTSFEPTSTSFRQLGITVSYTNGMLQIFVAYI